MKFHRKPTALALAMVSTVLLVAGVVSASAQSGTNRMSPKIGKAHRTSRDTSGFVYAMHLPPGKFFRVTYTSGLNRVDSSSLISHSGGAISRAVFAGDDFLLGTAIHTGRFSGELTQTLLVDSATLHGVAHLPAAGTVTLTNTDTGTRITLRDGERFSIPTG
ncbi:MAG TPA: hypothetical protein VGL78_01265 [Solirubrobacteraceae bacterium]